MFRWFAPNGPKIIPSVERLKDSFGFDVKRRDLRAGMGCRFEMVEDSHPANNWHQCVSDFPNVDTAYNWFGQYKIEPKDILWVRFCPEDRDFDYAKLRQFEFHDLEHKAARAEKIDKYIKGQEFSVVVIEGVGEHFNSFDNPQAMLEHRRELYLCASRATLFLFFIIRQGGASNRSSLIEQEFESLRSQLSKPLKPSDATQFWGLRFDANTSNQISFPEYQDLLEPIKELISENKTEPEVESQTDSDTVLVTKQESKLKPDLSDNQEIVTESVNASGQEPDSPEKLESEQGLKLETNSNGKPEVNESESKALLENESGSVLNLLEDKHNDLKNLSEDELSDLGDKIGKMSENGYITLGHTEKHVILNISKPDSEIESKPDSGIYLNREEFGELKGLKGEALKKVYKLYSEANILIAKTFRTEMNRLILSPKLLIQKNLLQPKELEVIGIQTKKLGNSELDAIRSIAKEYTDFLKFSPNDNLSVKDFKTLLIIVCYPIECLTFRLNRNCREFTDLYLSSVVRLTADKVVSDGQKLMRLRNDLSSLLFLKKPSITANLIQFKKELMSTLSTHEETEGKTFTSDNKTEVITKTETSTPENKQNLKTITMYSQEISPNELAAQLSVPFSALYKAKEELGQMWSRGKLDYCKVKRICTKFGCEVIDLSPKDNF